VSRVDLLWIGEGPAPHWALGRVASAAARPEAVASALAGAAASPDAAAHLLWGGRLGAPDAARVSRVLSRPGDAWHAGLLCGMGGLPRAIDFVEPTWMLNRDPDPSIEATSWRLSFDACLVRTEVLRRLGGPPPGMRSLAGSALELGHRWISRGALMRHAPDLLAAPPPPAAIELPLEDEFRFVLRRFGRLWLRWALARAVASRRLGPLAARSLWSALGRETRPPDPAPLREPAGPVSSDSSTAGPARAAVTILIPTVDRYPYLRTLLGQLRGQTVPPLEIVIVDQTPVARRDRALARDFADLPLRLMELDAAGQCSSRNAGLLAARGDYVLFLDDDDEVPPDLLERHLESLERHRNDVSSGVAEEDGAGPLPDAFRLTRASDVFPTNNSMLARGVLTRSGLFDLAYDRGARADGDLGMRIYLSGALMVLSADICVLHRHAPSGGLRAHKARVVTYASSRARLTHRNLPGRTEIYLWRRYFTPEQVREALRLSVFGTFGARGSRLRRLAKAGVSLVLLPHTLKTVRARDREAREMLRRFPQIPELPGERSAAGARS
jgi:glycosyltransferase involved in cell wall biosynthesis